jgi:hypothetical protein
LNCYNIWGRKVSTIETFDFEYIATADPMAALSGTSIPQLGQAETFLHYCFTRSDAASTRQWTAPTFRFRSAKS